MRWPDLSTILVGIPYAVAGAVATRAYMPERATSDLDIVVVAGDVPRAASRLRAAGYRERGALVIGRMAWLSPDGVPVDLIEGSEGWWPQALEEAAQHPDRDGEPILPLPWLVLMKLGASRVQDLADVTRMLGAASADDIGGVRGIVRTHAPDVGDDLDSLIALGRLEAEGGGPENLGPRI